MKTSKIILLLVFVFCIAIQCIAQKKKVALVTFYVDKYINIFELDGIVGTVYDIKQLAQSPDFDLQPTVDKFYEVFYTEYKPLLPFELLQEETVIKNPEYIAYESMQYETLNDKNPKFWQTFLTAPGYKTLFSQYTFSRVGRERDVTYIGTPSYTVKREKRNEIRLLEMFDNVADGVLFVSFSYAFRLKSIINGVEIWGVRAYIEMALYNKNADKVFFFNEYAWSPLTVNKVSGIPMFSSKVMLPLCESASDKLMADLKKKLPKLKKKVAKKF